VEFVASMAEFLSEVVCKRWMVMVDRSDDLVLIKFATILLGMAAVDGVSVATATMSCLIGKHMCSPTQLAVLRR